jgi:hypothetical protein
MSETQGMVNRDGAWVRVCKTSVGDAGVVTKTKIRFGYAQRVSVAQDDDHKDVA